MERSFRAWTVDADDIPLGGELDANVLHRTPEIEDFLDPGDVHFFVMGTKGQGKTLLLKAQRLAYQAQENAKLVSEARQAQYEPFDNDPQIGLHSDWFCRVDYGDDSW